MTTSPLVERLASIVRQQDPAMASTFESALIEAEAANGEAFVRNVIPLFGCDGVPDELLFSLVHLLERVDDSLYAQRMLSVSEQLEESSPRWAGIIYMRMLNSASMREVLAKQIESSEPCVFNAAKAILEGVVRKRPEFRDKVDKVVGRV